MVETTTGFERNTEQHQPSDMNRNAHPPNTKTPSKTPPRRRLSLQQTVRHQESSAHRHKPLVNTTTVRDPQPRLRHSRHLQSIKSISQLFIGRPLCDCDCRRLDHRLCSGKLNWNSPPIAKHFKIAFKFQQPSFSAISAVN
jgi:hypothetical protein